MCINHVGLLDSRAGRTYKISNNFLVLAHAWAALKYKIPYLNGSSVVEWAAEKKMILSVVDKYEWILLSDVPQKCSGSALRVQ